MSRLNKTEDIIKLAMLFQNSYCGICIDDIAEKFEVTRRTAERMKSLLFDLFPDKIEEVVRHDDRKKRWRFAKGTMNALISFDADDFANLEYLKNLSNDENRTEKIEDLIEKVKALTPQKNIITLNNDIDAILESEGYAVRQYSKPNINPKFLDDLRIAMMSLKKIKIEYKKNNNIYEFTINPYGIIISNRYFIVGYNEEMESLRIYRLDRVKSLKILDEYFEKDENFNLKDYCNRSFGVYQGKLQKVELEFDTMAAEDVLNYHFHPTQKIKKLPNGNINVKFVASGEYAICQELFKWGDLVKIKAPLEIKEYYKNYLTNTLKNL